MGDQFLVMNLGGPPGPRAEPPIRFGFGVELVTEVLPLPNPVRVPWAPKWVIGVMNHHGRLVTVVDLARFLELPGDDAPRIVVLVDRPDVNIGFAVSTVSVVDTRDAVEQSAPKQYLAHADWVVGALSTPELDFQKLDLPRVVEGVEAAF
jgi:chemotaxis signal transduction protein